MSSKIEWTDETWNPTTGCDRVSPGCDHCYAERMATRLAGRFGYPADEPFRLTLHPDRLDDPLRWHKPRMVFVNSMSDLFHHAVPSHVILDVFVRMGLANHHTFQVLTKRPGRMAKLLSHDRTRTEWFDRRHKRAVHDDVQCLFDRNAVSSACIWPLPNVWLGTSIENNDHVWRANALRRTPAAARFLSLEPLLGPLPSLDLTGIDWVIVGGESGPGARPMHPDWARDIRDRCVAAGVPFFFKQWGAWLPGGGVHWDERPGRWCFLTPQGDTTPGPAFGSASQGMQKVGKFAAGRVLDGRTWDEMPERAVVPV